MFFILRVMRVLITGRRLNFVSGLRSITSLYLISRPCITAAWVVAEGAPKYAQAVVVESELSLLCYDHCSHTTQSSQNICIFCACRFNATGPASRQFGGQQQRTLRTSLESNQSAPTAAAASQDSGQDGLPPTNQAPWDQAEDEQEARERAVLATRSRTLRKIHEQQERQVKEAGEKLSQLADSFEASKAAEKLPNAPGPASRALDARNGRRRDRSRTRNDSETVVGREPRIKATRPLLGPKIKYIDRPDTPRNVRMQHQRSSEQPSKDLDNGDVAEDQTERSVKQSFRKLERDFPKGAFRKFPAAESQKAQNAEARKAYEEKREKFFAARVKTLPLLETVTKDRHLGVRDTPTASEALSKAPKAQESIQDVAPPSWMRASGSAPKNVTPPSSSPSSLAWGVTDFTPRSIAQGDELPEETEARAALQSVSNVRYEENHDEEEERAALQRASNTVDGQLPDELEAGAALQTSDTARYEETLGDLEEPAASQRTSSTMGNQSHAEMRGRVPLRGKSNIPDHEAFDEKEEPAAFEAMHKASPAPPEQVEETSSAPSPELATDNALNTREASSSAPAQSSPDSAASPVPAATETSQSVPKSEWDDAEEAMFQAMLARRAAAAKSNSGMPAAKPLTSSPSTSIDADLFESEMQEREALAARAREVEEKQKRHPPEPIEHIPTRTGLKVKFHETRAPQSIKPFDPALTAQWDIFKTTPKPRNVEESYHEPKRSGLHSPQDIDAKFEEHRRQRAAANQPLDLGTIPYAPLVPRRPRPPPEQQKCARCGRMGHSAPDCKGAREPRDMDGRTRNQNRSIASDNTASNDPRTVPWRRVNLSRQIEDNPEESERNFLKSRRSGQIEDAGAGAPNKFSKDRNVEQDEDEKPAERILRSRKFADEGVRDSGRDRTRPARRPRGDDFEEADERPRRGRRNVEEDEDDDDRPRRGRRGSFEEEADMEGEHEGLREARDERKRARQAKKQKAAKEAEKRAARTARKADGMTQIQLPEFVSVQRLAQTLGVKYEDFADKMEDLGFTNTAYDHVLSAENASLIAGEFNFDASFGNQAEEDERDLRARPEVDDKEYLPSRPPVVAIMGHVDHGKTTLLDYLRKSSIAASEHGGITQHIGAFSVGLSNGKTITFLDTPGHAAFLAMRQRGAHITDIVILVVAADDSVKPQTLEALKHARDANVPIIVAVSKVDKEEANIDRVKQDLARHGIEIEDYGGDTQVIPVSGKTGQGMEDLEEATSTLSEILDHRAETDGAVEGWVIEATTKRAGRVATVLVKRGTLKPGDLLVAGKTWTRVRSLHDEAGQAVMSAGPGTPVEVDGWRDQPAAGDEVLQAPNEQKATDVVEYRSELGERSRLAEDMEAINELRRQEQERREREKAAEEAAKRASGDDDATSDPKTRQQQDPDASPSHQTVPFIVKADVSGSVEAVVAYILQMSNPLCSPTLLRSGVGPVSEFDIEHAAVAGGHIVSFNLPPDPNVVGNADKQGVKVLQQNVIYRVVDDVKGVLESKLPPIRTQRVMGEAEVAMSFEIGVGGRKKIKIAGCKVRNGVIGRGSKVRVLRNGNKIYDGKSFLWSESFGVSLIVHRCRFFTQECQEGCPRDAQGHRMWYWIRGLGRL